MMAKLSATFYALWGVLHIKAVHAAYLLPVNSHLISG